jgi:hypothetical protein
MRIHESTAQKSLAPLALAKPILVEKNKESDET